LPGPCRWRATIESSLARFVNTEPTLNRTNYVPIGDCATGSLAFWICVLFLGFGLFARFNATVTVALFVGALSVSGAVFLILELSDPYQGLMRISDLPLRTALVQID
jgi:hypothetical protein